MENLKNNIEEIKIGLQTWTLKNLNVAVFRNGESITEAKTSEDFAIAGKYGKPAWCFYENDFSNGNTYGKLYNWFAINDPRNIAPLGWHVPTESELTILAKYLGGNSVAGEKMKCQSGWMGNGGTNSSYFTAMPGGCRGISGKFFNLGRIGTWWSSTDAGYLDSACCRNLHDNSNAFSEISHPKHEGLSIRCLKD